MQDQMLGESMILEEDIDENYEPTQEEIIEYARFLGMDMINDKDLFWVAREGLKAPLPGAWKPCQTRDGEIYYFNFESGESTWEHPCDEYYRKMYEKEKKKKVEKEVTKRTQKTTKEKAGKEKEKEKPAERPGSGSRPAQKTGDYQSVPIKKDPLTLSDVLREKKANDPILKLEQEKKLKQYKDQKETEFTEAKVEYEKSVQSVVNELERRVDVERKNIQKRYAEIKDMKVLNLKKEYKPILEEDIPVEKRKYQEELRKDLERNYQQKIKLEKDKHNLEIRDIQSHYAGIKEDKIYNMSENITLENKREEDQLKLEVSKLRATTLALKNRPFDENTELENARRTYLNEEETRFQREVENRRNINDRQISLMKDAENKVYQEKVETYYKEHQKVDNSEFDEGRQHIILENELKNKIEDYKKFAGKQQEIKKLEILERLTEIKKVKIDAVYNYVKREADRLVLETPEEKEFLEKKFQEDKIKAEKQFEEDQNSFKYMMKKKLDEQKRVLIMMDDERVEKLAILKMKLGSFQNSGDEREESDQNLGKMERRINDLNNQLHKLREDLLNEEKTHDEYNLQLQSLEDKRRKREENPEPHPEIAKLQKTLNDRLKVLESFKLETIKLDNKTPTISDNEQIQIPTIHEETEEHEQAIHDLQDIRKSMKDILRKAKSPPPRMQGFLSPKAKTTVFQSQVISSEFMDERRRLEIKKKRLAADLAVIDRDQISFRGDRQKAQFLSDARKLIKSRLQQVSDRLNYLMKLELKIHKSASGIKFAPDSSVASDDFPLEYLSDEDKKRF